MAKRLTISSGEINFYTDTYNKCSNKNSNEVKSKVEQGIPYYAIKEYKYKEYTTNELSEIYSKLSKFEDIMEKYNFNDIEELDKKLADSNTWKNACELAIREPNSFRCPHPPEYYNAQDEYGSDEPFYIQDSVCEFADTPSECLECRLKYFYQQAKNMEDNIEKNNCNTDN